MTAGLTGDKALIRRVKALPKGLKPVSQGWARDTVGFMRAGVAVRTGRTKRSFRVGRATEERAVILGSEVAFFIDAGPKPHDIVAHTGGTLVFKGRHGTVFARKVHHRGYRARPFRRRAAEKALRRNPMAPKVIDAWNAAA